MIKENYTYLLNGKKRGEGPSFLKPGKSIRKTTLALSCILITT